MAKAAAGAMQDLNGDHHWVCLLYVIKAFPEFPIDPYAFQDSIREESRKCGTPLNAEMFPEITDNYL